ncbi:MAG: hypothetical protein K6G64_01815 [Eubacterium sp.]|nr:hypothetical protein [Eubacterium sp.]
MKYYRVHTKENAYITGQPRGIFTAVWKLVEEGVMNEKEVETYWKNKAYFEKVLPVPPFYEQGNPEGAVTWFKDNAQGNDIYEQMTFYREIAKKYGTRLYKSVSNEIPGEVIYEDDFQIAVKNVRDDIEFKTEEVV